MSQQDISKPQKIKKPYRVIISIITAWSFLFNSIALGSNRPSSSQLRPLATLERSNFDLHELDSILNSRGICTDAQIDKIHAAYQAGALDDDLDRYIGYLTRQAVLGSQLAAKYRDEFHARHKGDVGMAKEGGPELIQTDEVSCASNKLVAYFVGSKGDIYTKVSDTINNANPEGKNTITIGNVTFFKRATSGHTTWAFKKADIEKVAQLFDLALRTEIPKLSETEIVCSAKILARYFRGAQDSLFTKVSDAIEKANPEGDDAITIGKVKFFKRITGTHRIWAFNKTDVENVAKLFKLDIKTKFPKLSETEVACSADGLAIYFVGMPTKLTAKINDIINKANSEGKDTITLGKVKFFKRITGPNIIWAFNKADIEKVATLSELAIRTEISTISETEVACSSYVLVLYFIGQASNLAKKVNDTIKQANLEGNDIVTMGGVKFFKRKTGPGVVWAFSKADIQKVAKIFGFQLRIDYEERLEQLGLLEAVALLGDDPLRLQQYIRACYPELSYEEIERVTVSALNGLKPEWMQEKHQGYGDSLPPPILYETGHRLSTKENVFTLEGKVPPGSCEFVQVRGAYTRRVRVRDDGSFTAKIPLPKTGEVNEFEVYAVDETTKEKSPVVGVTVKQEGTKVNIDEALRLLLAMQGDILDAISRDPARHRFLLHVTEQSLLRYFTYNEASGFKYLRQRIQEEKSPALKAILIAVYDKFTAISKMKFKIKKGERLYFFQKYTIAEVTSLMAQGAKGVIIANEQGMGKTIVALALINGKEATIITPNAVVTTWAEEEEKFIPAPTIEVLEGSYREREQVLQTLTRPQVVTNIEFTRGMTQTRADLLCNPQGVLVVDEADYLGTLRSQQSQGTRVLKARSKLLLTATPFKRISQIGNILSFLRPDDPAFKSSKAFARAFPANSTTALNALFLLLQEHTIRIRKKDVFEEYDPKIPLVKQSHRIPKKDEIPPTSQATGQFYLTQEQCESIYELFTDYQAWCEKHRPNASMEDTEYYRYKEGYFSKREALRQIMNDSAYIGRPDIDSPKHQAMDRIVNNELDGKKNIGRKMLIFCRYRAQVEEYQKRYGNYGVRTYYGGLPQDSNGYRIDANGDLLYYEVDEYKNFILKDGKPIQTDKAHGRPIRALDYERILFQNDPDSRILVATYDTGALGVTLTAADAVVYDDLAQTYRDQYQAGDRAHRIDNVRKKYTVKYYWLQALYSKGFVDRLDDEDRETYFDVGSYDQVHYQSLQRQSRIFHRIMDGVGSEQELIEVNQRFMAEHMPFLFRRGEVERGEEIAEEQVKPTKKGKKSSLGIAEPQLKRIGNINKILRNI